MKTSRVSHTPSVHSRSQHTPSSIEKAIVKKHSEAPQESFIPSAKTEQPDLPPPTEHYQNTTNVLPGSPLDSSLTSDSPPKLDSRYPDFIQDLITQFKRLHPGSNNPDNDNIIKPTPAPQSIKEVKDRLSQLTFHKTDPFVATTAWGIKASISREFNPKDDFEFSLVNPSSKIRGTLSGHASFHHGPDAPMILMVAGVYGGSSGGQVEAMKHLFQKAGCNYVVLPNPMSDAFQKADPTFISGNIKLEAEAYVDILDTLKQKDPEYFDNVSLVSYSYGGLLNLNMARFEQERLQTTGEQPIINGGVIALSPAQNLYESTVQFDGWREMYRDKDTGHTNILALKYLWALARNPYKKMGDHGLFQRAYPETAAEIKMIDSTINLSGLRKHITTIDKQFGFNKLPLHDPKNAGRDEDELKKEQEAILKDYTYQKYMKEYLEESDWFKDQGIDPQTLSKEHSMARALDVLDQTHLPVVVFGSQDDMILTAEDLKLMQQWSNTESDNVVVQQLEHGGHVGAMYNPEVRDTLVSLFGKLPQQEQQQALFA